MVGMKTLAKTRFRAALLVAPQGLLLKEAADVLNSLASQAEALVVTTDSSQPPRFCLYPIICYPHPASKGYTIDLAGGYSKYLGHLTASGRRRFRQALERLALANDGKADFRVYRSRTEVAAFVRAAAAVTPKTHQWQRSKMGVAGTDDEIAGMEKDAERDAFRGYVLFIQGRPTAFCSCFALDDVLHGNLIGYDPDFRQLSPGFALLHLLLESLFEDRFRTFDLGPDGFDYKVALSTGTYDRLDVFYLPTTVRNVIWTLAHRSFSRAMSSLSLLRKRLQPAISWRSRRPASSPRRPSRQPHCKPSDVHR